MRSSGINGSRARKLAAALVLNAPGWIGSSTAGRSGSKIDDASTRVILSIGIDIGTESTKTMVKAGTIVSAKLRSLSRSSTRSPMNPQKSDDETRDSEIAALEPLVHEIPNIDSAISEIARLSAELTLP